MSKLTDAIVATTGVIGAAVLIALVLCIAPMLCLWGVNTISEQAQLGWYIPHNLWTYLGTIAVLITVRGGD